MSDFHASIVGMNCASCANDIEKAVSKLDGVSSATVNYSLSNAKFVFSEPATKTQISQLIRSLGYQAKIVDERESEQEKKDEDEQRSKKPFYNFLVSMLLSVGVFLLEMTPLGGAFSKEVNWYVQLALTLPIWVWFGREFLYAFYQFVISGRSNMNTLIGIGTTAAFTYSTFITIFPVFSIDAGLTPQVYFEAVGFIISFVYLGKFFENQAKKKTKEAMNALFSLAVKDALVVGESGVESVPLESVAVGNILRVLPGAKFPVDGVVIKGSSNVDESMVTGEPLAVKKQVSDHVTSGTLNLDGTVDIEANRVGKDSFVSQMIDYVKNAQLSKANIQTYADRITGVFTPVVIIIAFVTLFSWFFGGPDPRWGNSISAFIAVLVIACPCALGLATPTAVVVATGRASLRGILISGGDIIEKACDIDVVLFDKTGTLTRGTPAVIESLGINGDGSGDGSGDLLYEVACIEQFSEHPLSKAIVSFYKARSSNSELAEPDEFLAVKGHGIEAAIKGSQYLIGNEDLLSSHSIQTKEGLKPTKLGSFVYIAKEGLHVATLVIGDEIKDEARDAVLNLKNRGIETWMVTGDNQQVAEAVSKELCIEHYRANVKPLEKTEIVDQLQQMGKKVAMVGDGINDAPALAKADLSIAMGGGAEVAIDASDVTILKGDLGRLIEFVDLSRFAMRVIKQNLYLSLLYNTLLIPVAAGFLVVFGGPMMPPVLASIAMALSSVSVVLNSLRIRD